jgi:hypothetical protein
MNPLDDAFDVGRVSAVDARAHVVELEAERALAQATGVGSISRYMDDLDWELDAWRQVYTAAAVTEIAILRAGFDGPLLDG